MSADVNLFDGIALQGAGWIRQACDRGRQLALVASYDPQAVSHGTMGICHQQQRTG